MTDKALYIVLNALQEAVFILDANRTVLFENSVAEELFGSGFVGSDFVQVIRHPECMKIIDQVLDGENAVEKSITIEYPVKAVFNVLVSNISVDTGQEIKLLVSLEDISDLLEAEQMRSDFVANVSHELRSPLTALAGFTETLRGPAKDDEAARDRFLGLMEREASRMTRLISDLLSLSKVEANLRVRPSGQVDIAALVHRIEATLDAQVKKEKKKLELNVTSQNSVITGNEDELTQVSKITVEIFEQENVVGIPGTAMAVKICDQGNGIEKEHLSRLTERFYRVDTHRSRDKGGTGLGLAIVKHIVNRHRGRLQIDSEVGIGSTFSVYLPIKH
jgi:two-component system phosphate regulon sensor histidine kinase PhoR